MLESLLQETRDLIDNVERETNLKVRIESSETKYLSKTLLSDYLGNGGNEITLTYNPSYNSADYAIAHEAARFLRYSRVPPGQRHALVENRDTRKRAYEQMEEETNNKDPKLKAIIKDVFPILYDGLMTQLVSTPADFWINQWLYDSYPNLRGEIDEGLNKIALIANKGLSYQTQMLIPETVYKASNSMNAAFLSFAAELLGREELAEPYRNTIFEAIGEKLRSHNSKDRGHLGDKETTDNWARELNLEGWYGWRRF